MLVTDTCTGATILSNPITIFLVTGEAPLISITVIPNDTVCIDSPVTFHANTLWGGAHPSFQWEKNGINVGTNSPSFSYIPVNGDSVICILTSSYSCIIFPGISNTIRLSVTNCLSGVNGKTLSEDNIYPNPAYNELTISLPGGNFRSFTIMNVIGQTVMSRNIVAVRTTINVNMLPRGVYYIKILGDKFFVAGKFIKM
jgi:Secretion system C-terminal sorting domain